MLARVGHAVCMPNKHCSAIMVIHSTYCQYEHNLDEKLLLPYPKNRHKFISVYVTRHCVGKKVVRVCSLLRIFWYHLITPALRFT